MKRPKTLGPLLGKMTERGFRSGTRVLPVQASVSVHASKRFFPSFWSKRRHASPMRLAETFGLDNGDCCFPPAAPPNNRTHPASLVRVAILPCSSMITIASVEVAQSSRYSSSVRRVSDEGGIVANGFHSGPPRVALWLGRCRFRRGFLAMIHASIFFPRRPAAPHRKAEQHREIPGGRSSLDLAAGAVTQLLDF